MFGGSGENVPQNILVRQGPWRGWETNLIGIAFSTMRYSKFFFPKKG